MPLSDLERDDAARKLRRYDPDEVYRNQNGGIGRNDRLSDKLSEYLPGYDPAEPFAFGNEEYSAARFAIQELSHQEVPYLDEFATTVLQDISQIIERMHEVHVTTHGGWEKAIEEFGDPKKVFANWINRRTQLSHIIDTPYDLSAISELEVDYKGRNMTLKELIPSMTKVKTIGGALSLIVSMVSPALLDYAARNAKKNIGGLNRAQPLISYDVMETFQQYIENFYRSALVFRRTLGGNLSRQLPSMIQKNPWNAFLGNEESEEKVHQDQYAPVGMYDMVDKKKFIFPTDASGKQPGIYIQSQYDPTIEPILNEMNRQKKTVISLGKEFFKKYGSYLGNAIKVDMLPAGVPLTEDREKGELYILGLRKMNETANPDLMSWGDVTAKIAQNALMAATETDPRKRQAINFLFDVSMENDLNRPTSPASPMTLEERIIAFASGSGEDAEEIAQGMRDLAKITPILKAKEHIDILNELALSAQGTTLIGIWVSQHENKRGKPTARYQAFPFAIKNGYKNMPQEIEEKIYGNFFDKLAAVMPGAVTVTEKTTSDVGSVKQYPDVAYGNLGVFVPSDFMSFFNRPVQQFKEKILGKNSYNLIAAARTFHFATPNSQNLGPTGYVPLIINKTIATNMGLFYNELVQETDDAERNYLANQIKRASRFVRPFLEPVMANFDRSYHIIPESEDVNAADLFDQLGTYGNRKMRFDVYENNVRHAIIQQMMEEYKLAGKKFSLDENHLDVSVELIHRVNEELSKHPNPLALKSTQKAIHLAQILKVGVDPRTGDLDTDIYNQFVQKKSQEIFESMTTLGKKASIKYEYHGDDVEIEAIDVPGTELLVRQGDGPLQAFRNIVGKNTYRGYVDNIEILPTSEFPGYKGPVHYRYDYDKSLTLYDKNGKFLIKSDNFVEDFLNFEGARTSDAAIQASDKLDHNPLMGFFLGIDRDLNSADIDDLTGITNKWYQRLVYESMLPSVPKTALGNYLQFLNVYGLRHDYTSQQSPYPTHINEMVIPGNSSRIFADSIQAQFISDADIDLERQLKVLNPYVFEDMGKTLKGINKASPLFRRDVVQYATDQENLTSSGLRWKILYGFYDQAGRPIRSSYATASAHLSVIGEEIGMRLEIIPGKEGEFAKRLNDLAKKDRAVYERVLKYLPDAYQQYQNVVAFSSRTYEFKGKNPVKVVEDMYLDYGSNEANRKILDLLRRDEEMPREEREYTTGELERIYTYVLNDQQARGPLREIALRDFKATAGDMRIQLLREQMMKPGEEVVFFDFETTPLEPNKLKAVTPKNQTPISLYGAIYRDGQLISEFKRYINPGVRISEKITKLTGITDEMVQDAPNIETVLREFQEFVGDRPLAGYNSFMFDEKYLEEHDVLLQNKKYDVMKMFNRLFTDQGLIGKVLKGGTNAAVAVRLGLITPKEAAENAHEAGWDTRVTAQVNYALQDIIAALNAQYDEEGNLVTQKPIRAFDTQLPAGDENGVYPMVQTAILNAHSRMPAPERVNANAETDPRDIPFVPRLHPSLLSDLAYETKYSRSNIARSLARYHFNVSGKLVDPIDKQFIEAGNRFEENFAQEAAERIQLEWVIKNTSKESPGIVASAEQVPSLGIDVAFKPDIIGIRKSDGKVVIADLKWSRTLEKAMEKLNNPELVQAQITAYAMGLADLASTLNAKQFARAIYPMFVQDGKAIYDKKTIWTYANQLQKAIRENGIETGIVPGINNPETGLMEFANGIYYQSFDWKSPQNQEAVARGIQKWIDVNTTELPERAIDVENTLKALGVYQKVPKEIRDLIAYHADKARRRTSVPGGADLNEGLSRAINRLRSDNGSILYSGYTGNVSSDFYEGRIIRDESGYNLVNRRGVVIANQSQLSNMVTELTNYLNGPLPENSTEAAATLLKRLYEGIGKVVSNYSAAMEKVSSVEVANQAGQSVRTLLNSARGVIEDAILSETGSVNLKDPKADFLSRSSYKLKTIEDFQKVQVLYPRLASLSLNDAKRMMASEQATVISDVGSDGEEVSFQLGGIQYSNSKFWKSKFSSDGGSPMLPFKSSAGNLFYGAYLLKRAWSMGMQPMMQEVEAYEKTLSNIGSIIALGNANALPAVDAYTGQATRENISKEYFNRTTYQVLGGFRNTGYELSQSGNDWVGRSWTYARTAGSAFMSAAALSTMVGGAGTTLGAALPVVGGIIAGTVMAAGIVYEVTNAVEKAQGSLPDGYVKTPGNTWQEILDTFSGKRSKRKALASDYVNQLYTRSKATGKTVAQLMKEDGVDQATINRINYAIDLDQRYQFGSDQSKRAQNTYKLSTWGLPQSYAENMQEETKKMAIQFMSSARDFDGSFFAERYGDEAVDGLYSKAYEPPEVKEIRKAAEEVASITGEEFDPSYRGLLLAKRMFGNISIEERYDIARKSVNMGRALEKYVAEAAAYAGNYGFLPGTKAFYGKAQEYFSATSENELTELSYSAEVTNRFGKTIQEQLGADPSFAGIGAKVVSTYNLSGLQANTLAKLLETSKTFGGEADSLTVQRAARVLSESVPSNVLSASPYLSQAYVTSGYTVEQAVDLTTSQLSGVNLTNAQSLYFTSAMQMDQRSMSLITQDFGSSAFNFTDQWGVSSINTNGYDYLTANYNTAKNAGELSRFMAIGGLNAQSGWNKKIAEKYLRGMGLSDTYTKAFLEGGQSAVQLAYNEERYQLSMAGAGLQAAGVRLAQQYYWGSGTWDNPGEGSAWYYEDVQRQKQYEYQQADFRSQSRRMQFTNQMNIARENNTYQRMITSQNYNLWSMAFNYNQSLMQREWSQEDWDYQDQMRGLNYGWQMEDYDLNIRYSSGRQRRQLVKQKERATISFNLESEQIDKQHERQEQTWSLEDERYRKTREYQLELMDLDKESFELNKKQRETLYQFDTEDFNRRKKEYQEQYDLQEKIIDLQRKYQKDQLDLQLQSAGLAAKGAELSKEIADNSVKAEPGFERINGLFKIISETKSAPVLNTILEIVKELNKPQGADKAREIRAMIKELSLMPNSGGN